ncbi:MAG: peptidyl-tRNA hydrolase [Actinomycetota bacterium]
MTHAEDQESPWALQLAVRVEKLTPPTTLAVCRATVLATISLLDDERTRPGGEWHEAIASWSEVRIRKIVRRGRASAWERAQDVPGVTVEHDGAEVRAFVPSRMADAPRDVAKLQIQSTPLDEVDLLDELPTIEPGAMVVAVTPAVEMSWGKMAAQCAHAGQLLWWAADDDRRSDWTDADRPILVVPARESLWSQLVEASEVQVRDAGFTEIPAGTNTTVAWWAQITP